MADQGDRMKKYHNLERLRMSRGAREALQEHCLRKLEERYITGESRERKAFGLLAGTVDGPVGTIERCWPLLGNVRGEQPYKALMDAVMSAHAVVSETPFAKRGWVADPAELLAIHKECRALGLEVLSTYHMHRVAWDHDGKRDTPTLLDTVLGEDTHLFMVIVSVVEPAAPVIRAFYEGRPDREVPLEFLP